MVWLQAKAIEQSLGQNFPLRFWIENLLVARKTFLLKTVIKFGIISIEDKFLYHLEKFSSKLLRTRSQGLKQTWWATFCWRFWLYLWLDLKPQGLEMETKTPCKSRNLIWEELLFNLMQGKVSRGWRRRLIIIEIESRYLSLGLIL